MLLTEKDKLFARLNELGFEEVQRLRNRGENPGSDEMVREWLEIQGYQRLEEAHQLHRRATEAAERSASASERASRYAMYTAIIALIAIIVSMVWPK